MLPKQSTAKINPLVQQKKLSGTQNKDKLAHSQKLQVFFFINKKEKKETTQQEKQKTNEVRSHWGYKGQTLSYTFPEI